MTNNYQHWSGTLMPGVLWMRHVLVTPHPLQLQGLGEVEPCELCCVAGYLEVLGCKRLGTQCKAGHLRLDLRKSKGMRSGWDSTVCKEARAWWALNSPEVHEAPSLLSGDILGLASSSVGLIPIPNCLFLTSLGARGRQPSLLRGVGEWGRFLTLHRPKSCLQDKLPYQPPGLVCWGLTPG